MIWIMPPRFRQRGWYPRRIDGTGQAAALVPCEVQTVRLTAVTGASPENKAFYAASPRGSFERGCVNAEAHEQFVLDGEYYIDFTKA